MYRIILLLFLSIVFTVASSCSVAASLSSDVKYQKSTVELMLEDKSKSYPYFNIDFGSFMVVNAPIQSGVVVTELILNAYHKLTVKEKSYMLRNLDIIRFVLNTQEFEVEMKTRTFRSSRKGSGPNGTIIFGSVYDNDRIMEILKNRKYSLSIHKDRITKNAQAVGILGEFLYVLDDNDPRTTNSYWIAMPNHEIWDRDLYENEDFIAPIVFHEMLHNTGFAHGIAEHDTVYELQSVFARVYSTSTFKKKYAKDLESFRPFYEEKYKGWLKSDTLSYNKSLVNVIESAETNYSYSYINEGAVYCAVYSNNTHTMYTNEVK